MLNVSPEMLRLGLSTAVVVARGLAQSGTPPALVDYRRKVGEQLAAHWKKPLLASHPVLQEYERLHQSFSVTNAPAAPQQLLEFLKRNKDLPAVGPIVDCYNIVSAKTLLSIGAHDLAKIKTPIALRPVTEGDLFVPLGSNEPQSCAGEYAYVDPDRRIICRMEVLQADFTKVDPDSREVIFFLQGNRRIPTSELLLGAWLLVELVERFLGGSAELVCFQEAVNRTAA